MTDICLLMRIGTHLDNALRKTLYAMAQYMIEAERRGVFVYNMFQIFIYTTSFLILSERLPFNFPGYDDDFSRVTASSNPINFSGDVVRVCLLSAQPVMR